MDIDQIHEISFQIITAAGMAKSDYMEALYLFKDGEAAEAKAKLKEGDEAAARAKDHHMVLLRKECKDKVPQVALLLMHAEDQLLSVETIKIMVEELMEVYALIRSIPS